MILIVFILFLISVLVSLVLYMLGFTESEKKQNEINKITVNVLENNNNIVKDLAERVAVLEKKLEEKR